jgi:hypothetical protein
VGVGVSEGVAEEEKVIEEVGVGVWVSDGVGDEDGEPVAEKPVLFFLFKIFDESLKIILVSIIF